MGTFMSTDSSTDHSSALLGRGGGRGGGGGRVQAVVREDTTEDEDRRRVKGSQDGAGPCGRCSWHLCRSEGARLRRLDARRCGASRRAKGVSPVQVEGVEVEAHGGGEDDGVLERRAAQYGWDGWDGSNGWDGWDGSNGWDGWDGSNGWDGWAGRAYRAGVNVGEAGGRARLYGLYRGLDRGLARGLAKGRGTSEPA